MSSLLDFLNRLVTTRKRDQRISLPSQTLIKVNLGAGLDTRSDWISIDSSPNALMGRLPRPFLGLAYRLAGYRNSITLDEYIERVRTGNFVHHDLRYGLPFQDQAVDFIYTSHFLEHLPREATEQLVREAIRVLRPGGSIRITVPDLSYVVDLYMQNRKHEAVNLLFSNLAGERDRHRYMYDFDMLHELLAEVGFEAIEKCAFREGRVPDCDVLDNRPEQTVFVEATKPH